jgi:hypothetical protein
LKRKKEVYECSFNDIIRVSYIGTTFFVEEDLVTHLRRDSREKNLHQPGRMEIHPPGVMAKYIEK